MFCTASTCFYISYLASISAGAGCSGIAGERAAESQGNFSGISLRCSDQGALLKCSGNRGQFGALDLQHVGSHRRRCGAGHRRFPATERRERHANYPLRPEPVHTPEIGEPMRRHLQTIYDAKGLGSVPEPQGAASDVSREHVAMLPDGVSSPRGRRPAALLPRSTGTPHAARTSGSRLARPSLARVRFRPRRQAR